MKFYGVRLLVEDFPACFRFYRDILGLELVWGEEEGPYADFQTESGSYISLFLRKFMSEAIGTESLPSKAESQDNTVVVIQVDDLEETVETLKFKNAAVVTEPKEYPAWTIRAAHFRDPDGNLIELFSPLSKEKWSDEVRERDERTS